MDTFFSMKVFTKVAEAGNFAEAARRLKLSAPMVTRHIRSLEQRIGTRLINRTTHRFSLTEAGHIYNERCIRLLADITEAESATSAPARWRVVDDDRARPFHRIGEGRTRHQLEKLADDRVLLPGFKDNVRDYLQIMDVFVSAAREEAFGLSIVEACEAGLPVIASSAKAR